MVAWTRAAALDRGRSGGVEVHFEVELMKFGGRRLAGGVKAK